MGLRARAIAGARLGRPVNVVVNYGREPHAKTGSEHRSDWLLGPMVERVRGPIRHRLYVGRLDSHMACLRAGSGCGASFSDRGTNLSGTCASLCCAGTKLWSGSALLRGSTSFLLQCTGNDIACAQLWSRLTFYSERCRCIVPPTDSKRRNTYPASKISFDLGSRAHHELPPDRQLRPGDRMADDHDAPLHNLHLATPASAGRWPGKQVFGCVAKSIRTCVSGSRASRRYLRTGTRGNPGLDGFRGASFARDFGLPNADLSNAGLRCTGQCLPQRS